MNTVLKTAFSEYLSSRLNVQSAMNLSKRLHDFGFHNEALALEKYGENGSETSFTITEDSAWHGYKCFIGSEPYKNAHIGDLWFDLTELTMMILIELKDFAFSQLERAWISTRPVYSWQFQGFLNLVRWRFNTYDPEPPSNALSKSGLQFSEAEQFASNVTFEEALAYSRWFRKDLCGRFELIAASGTLSSAQLSSVLPQQMGLLGPAQSGLDGFSFVTSIQNLTNNPVDELNTSSNTQQGRYSILHRFQHRSPDIGFCTAFFEQDGLIDPVVPIMISDRLNSYIELLNIAPRALTPKKTSIKVIKSDGMYTYLDICLESNYNLDAVRDIDEIPPVFGERFRLDSRLHQANNEHILTALEHAVGRKLKTHDFPKTWGEAAEFLNTNQSLVRYHINLG